MSAQAQTSLWEIKYVNACHLKANRQFARKLQAAYVLADNFRDAAAAAHQQKEADHNIFSVTLEQQGVTLLK